jgi:hypothetical protein
MRSKPRFLVLFGAAAVLAGSGCAPYVQVQSDLVTQARRGVAMTADSLRADRGQIEQYQLLRRQRLDEAFDADVRDRAAAAFGSLSPDWVIESRKAYAAGLDALAAAREQSHLNAAAEQRTLKAIDDALAQVQALQSAQLRLSQSFFPPASNQPEGQP